MDSAEQTIDILKTYIDVQYNSYYIIIIGLIAITAIIVGYNMFWNINITKKQIQSEVDNIKEELTEYFKDKEIGLIKTLNKELSKKIDLKYYDAYSDISRIIAINAFEAKSYLSALIWWFTCLDNSLKAKRDSLVRIAIDGIIKTLNISTLTQYTKKAFNMEYAIKTINDVSDTLSSEKEDVLLKLSRLKVTK